MEIESKQGSLENIHIVDNCVSQTFQDFLAKQLEANNLSWGFIEDVTNNPKEKSEMVPGFSNSPFDSGNVFNTAYWFLYPLLLEACGKKNIAVKELLRIRIGLYLKKNENSVNSAHVDRNVPHMTALYYPNDFDGDTVFYTDSTATTELLRVTPKKGRMVIFDGLIYHASSNPMTNSHRITVNFNFIA